MESFLIYEASFSYGSEIQNFSLSRAMGATTLAKILDLLQAYGTGLVVTNRSCTSASRIK